MFNVGGGELLVIMLIALIVLGPQRLPDAARQVGKVLGDLRKLSSGFQNEMKTAFAEADDPTRVSARRNVLAKEAPPPAEDDPVEPPLADDAPVAADAPVSEAVAAVSRQPTATPKKVAPARAKTTSPTAAKSGAADETPVEKAPPPPSTS